MVYCYPDDVRRYCGFRVDDVDDADLEFYIERATEDVIQDITIPRFGDTLSGLCDGSNRDFYTPYVPIADVNGDCTVTASDVTVVAWGVAGSIDTRVTFDVASIDDYYGRIRLSSAPASTFVQVTANYSIYLAPIDWSEITIATAYLAGAYYVFKEFLLIPERFAPGGPIRFTHSNPYLKLEREYYKHLLRAKNKDIAVGYTKDRKRIRKEMS